MTERVRGPWVVPSKTLPSLSEWLCPAWFKNHINPSFLLFLLPFLFLYLSSSFLPAINFRAKIIKRKYFSSAPSEQPWRWLETVSGTLRIQQGTVFFFPFGTHLVPPVTLVWQAHTGGLLWSFFFFFPGQKVPQLSLLHRLYSVYIPYPPQHLKHDYALLQSLTSVSRSSYIWEGYKMQLVKMKLWPLGTSMSLSDTSHS